MKVCILLSLVFVLAAGCGLSKQQITKMEYVEGCYFSIETVSSTKAKKIDKDWQINPPCDVIFDSDVTSDKEN